MRDPKRIDRVLGAVKRLWQQQPDLRLCQLISNAVGLATYKETPDCFYIEDEVLLKGLELYIEEIFRAAVEKKKVANGQSNSSADFVSQVRDGTVSESATRRSGEV